MCIISFDALTDRTFIYIGKLTSFESKEKRQVMAYKNSIKNKSGEVNAMHIPVPTKSLKPENVLDWADEPNLLEDIYTELASKSGSRAAVGVRKIASSNYIVENTDYVIALINDITLIEETLDDPRFLGYKVPDWVVPFYIKNYGVEDFTFVWAIFKHTEVKSCSPLAFEFVPSMPDYLYFPTLDAHGAAPIIGAPEDLDQILIMGSVDSNMDVYTNFGDMKWDKTSKNYSEVAKNSAYSSYFPEILHILELAPDRKYSINKDIGVVLEEVENLQQGDGVRDHAHLVTTYKP